MASSVQVKKMKAMKEREGGVKEVKFMKGAERMRIVKVNNCMSGLICHKII